MLSALAQSTLATIATAARRDGPRGELFARYMERRGKRVVEASGRYWHSQQGRFFSLAPYQDKVEVDPSEIDRMLWRERAIGVRYLAADGCGLPIGLYVMRDRDYDISRLSASGRRNTRRGLQTFEIRPLTHEELLQQGLACNRDTLARQARDDPEYSAEKNWRRLVDAVFASEGVDAIGAVRDGVVAAYLIVYGEHGWFHFLRHFSRTSELKLFPNEALWFEVTRAAIARPEIETVCSGTVGLSSGEGLDEFKHRLGYRLEPAAWGVRWHPLAAPCASSGVVAGGLANLRRRLPQNDRLGKLAAVVEGARRTRLGIAAEWIEGAEHP